MEQNLGSPDADADDARGPIHLQEVFIQDRGVQDFMDPDCHQLAVAGPKGVGKTLLLFNKNIAAHQRKEAKETGTIVVPHNSPHAFRPTAEFAQLLKSQSALKGQLTSDAWTGLWEWALSMSILVIWHEYAKENAHRERFEEHAKSLGGHLARPEVPGALHADPYRNLITFLKAATTGVHSRGGHLIVPSPTEYVDLVSSFSEKFPATFVYIDNQDDYFPEDPDLWISCGFGTFRALRTIRARTGTRVHCCMALRSEVFWRIAKSADALKYRNDIFLLEWDDSSLRDVFERRVERLNPKHLMAPKDPNPVRAFFGQIDDKSNTGREPIIQTEVSDRTQRALDYLLRFTLGRPRDAIAIGNGIIRARTVARQEDLSGKRYAKLVRETIHKEAEAISEAYISEVKHRWRWDKQYPLDKFLQQQVPWDLLHVDDLKAICRKFAEAINEPINDVHPFCALAGFGLLGWPKVSAGSATVHFPSLVAPPVPAIPGDVKWVVLHPVLQQRFSIKTNERILVGHGEPFDSKVAEQFRKSQGPLVA